jgi:arylsulfatase A-like enzyme
MVPAYAYLNFATELRDYVAAYDADIRFLDDQLGRLLDWMTSRGLLERTVVVVTADHGEGLGGHDYYFEHGRLPYDDCARVPLIVVHPHWPARRVAEPVALMDLAPTLLDDAGLRPGWQFEGQSLLPWLAAGAPNESARPVYVESGYAKKFDVSIRRGRWKLICFGEKFVADLVGASRYELYDIVADPLETRNLADDEPEVRAELQELLDAHAAEAWSKRPPDPSGVALTAEEIAEMERLGYVGDGGDGDGGDGVGDEPAAERTGGAQR